jgi:hypothetical protein
MFVGAQKDGAADTLHRPTSQANLATFPDCAALSANFIPGRGALVKEWRVGMKDEG